jgi:hypothetical protein
MQALWPNSKNFFGVIYAPSGITIVKTQGNMPIGAEITPKKFYEIGQRLPVAMNK